eukprot:ANDGO_01790.mRNA.1 WD repeat protein iqw1
MHPLEENIVAYSSADRVELVDVRFPRSPRSFFVRSSVRQEFPQPVVVDLRWNRKGSLLAASYQYDDVFVFSAQLDALDPDDGATVGSQRCVCRGAISLLTMKDVCFGGFADEYIVSGSEDGSILFWDSENGNPVHIVSKCDRNAVNSVAFHPRLPQFFSSGVDPTIKVWGPSSLDSFPDRRNASAGEPAGQFFKSSVEASELTKRDADQVAADIVSWRPERHWRYSRFQDEHS